MWPYQSATQKACLRFSVVEMFGLLRMPRKMMKLHLHKSVSYWHEPKNRRRGVKTCRCENREIEKARNYIGTAQRNSWWAAELRREYSVEVGQCGWWRYHENPGVSSKRGLWDMRCMQSIPWHAFLRNEMVGKSSIIPMCTTMRPFTLKMRTRL